MNRLLPIILAIVMLFAFSGCDKEEVSTTGRLLINYDYELSISHMKIDTEAGNTIYAVSSPAQKFSLDLNPETYSIATTTASGSGLLRNYFQIQAGKTTQVSFNRNMEFSVKYE